MLSRGSWIYLPASLSSVLTDVECRDTDLGTPEKENCASLSAAKDQGGQAARKLGHAVTGDLAASSRQMFLRTTQEEPGHCQE
jgi:hypothetical protein